VPSIVDCEVRDAKKHTSTTASWGAVADGASAAAVRRQRAASTARVRAEVASLRSTLMPLSCMHESKFRSTGEGRQSKSAITLRNTAHDLQVWQDDTSNRAQLRASTWVSRIH